MTTHKIPEIIREARWIWPESNHWDMHNCYAQFRKPFKLDCVPSSAPLFITADQSYQLYVNGRFVCRGPARGFQSHWPYDEVDLHPFLRVGMNVIAVRAHNPGFSNFQYLSQGFAGLLVAAQWDDLKIVTDGSWSCRRQTGISKGTVPTSVQLFPQEHIDARLERDDWMEPDFDASGWPPLSPTNWPGVSWNSMPWYDLEPRQIPLLQEKTLLPEAWIGTSDGTCADGYRDTRDVTFVRHEEGLRHDPAPPNAAFMPLHVPATGENRFRSYLLDFGRTVVGNLSIGISGTCGNEIVDTLHTETIDAETLEPHFFIPTHSRVAFGSRLVCREGTTRHTFFHPFGFRYLTLTVRDTSSPVEIQLRLNWIGYPLERKGAFISSDRELEKIWNACAWTQQCCMLDAYVDTPWREQAQWWGDARVQAWNTFHLNGDPRLLRRGIGILASQTVPNGLTYGHAPTMAHNCILPDFTLIWVITIWDYYWQTESLEPFIEHQQAISRALAYFIDRLDPRFRLVPYDPRYWLFLDWTDLPREGCSSILNLWLLFAIEKVIAMHRACGNRAEADAFEETHSILKTGLLSLLDENGLMHDGRDPNGKVEPSTSIHAQTLAIACKIAPNCEESMVSRILLPYIQGKTTPSATPSAYWITYLFSVLSEKGYGKELLDFIKPRWSPMADYGTTWENFQPQIGSESHSHAWSAHPLFHLMQIVGGITQKAEAWKTIRFAPTFHGSEGGTTIPSPSGPIRSHWQRRENAIKVELDLPDGVTADVQLPGLREHGVQGLRQWTLAAGDV